MNYFRAKYFPSYLLLGGGFYLSFLSVSRASMAIFFMGIALILGGVFYLMIVSVIELFRKDKEINIAHFRKEGFDIVRCKECNRENLLVDKYCIYCGEELESESNEELQEEH